MKNLVLIGMMGCGKTTCGKLLSAKLNRPLVDTDEVIVAREGRTINDIFAAEGEEYCLVQQLVDEAVCNPLKVWHDLGEPASLSAEQKELLQSCARPQITTRRLRAEGGIVTVPVRLGRNAVAALELRPVRTCSDRGYDYERAVF